MDTNTPAPAAPAEAALFDQIRADVRGAAELAVCLALRGTQIASTAAPGQTTLANLAAAGQSVADQARSSSEAIFLLTTPATSPAGQLATEETVTRLRHAGEWAKMLHCQLDAAVTIHAVICAELSDRAAVAEEWTAQTDEQLRSPASARTLATFARMLTDSVSS